MGYVLKYISDGVYCSGRHDDFFVRDVVVNIHPYQYKYRKKEGDGRADDDVKGG